MLHDAGGMPGGSGIVTAMAKDKTKDKPDDGDEPKSSMKSFKDLLRARGGDPEPEADEKDRGWTLETYQGHAVDDATDRGVESSRDRITRRPAAFDAMTHGPAVYADVESEEMGILGSFRVRTVFPKDVLDEVESLPDNPNEEDFEGRVDLRGKMIFTIDGCRCQRLRRRDRHRTARERQLRNRRPHRRRWPLRTSRNETRRRSARPCDKRLFTGPSRTDVAREPLQWVVLPASALQSPRLFGDDGV